MIVGVYILWERMNVNDEKPRGKCKKDFFRFYWGPDFFRIASRFTKKRIRIRNISVLCYCIVVEN